MTSKARRGRGKQHAERLRLNLVDLLCNFQQHFVDGNLRDKVLALVPRQRLLRDLGCSLFEDEDATSGMDRVLAYLRKYPFTVISGEELGVVSGI
jgi:hypothetical protein